MWPPVTVATPHGIASGLTAGEGELQKWSPFFPLNLSSSTLSFPLSIINVCVCSRPMLHCTFQLLKNRSTLWAQVLIYYIGLAGRPILLNKKWVWHQVINNTIVISCSWNNDIYRWGHWYLWYLWVIYKILHNICFYTLCKSYSSKRKRSLITR